MIDNIYFEGDNVVVLDQSRLPTEVIYVTLETPQDVAEAIFKLKVRGAPLIGVTAAYGLAMAIAKYDGAKAGLGNYFTEIKALLAATRPTAVNLFWALQRMEQVFNHNVDQEFSVIIQVLKDEALAMFAEDVATNQAMGEYGQTLITKPSRVMTICNAGHLATGGYGTALGVIRAAHQRDNVKGVWALETRPVLQGSRLTVWELNEDNIPVTLITDSMAGYVMSRGEVDLIVVGADRIAANGDTANKIGTYTLAVLAKHHQIPFYVAAPISTIDFNIGVGKEIPIEQRHADEVRQVMGAWLSIPQVEVFNPAFDVTPHELIQGIITEKGIIKAPYIESILGLKD